MSPERKDPVHEAWNAELPLRVLHSGLNLVQTWLYRLIESLPSEVESTVACLFARDIHGFEMPQTRTLWNESRAAYWTERIARRIGFRRPLQFLARVARDNAPQLIHSHAASVAWADLPTADRLGLPHIASCYGGGDLPALPRQRPAWMPRCRELFKGVQLMLCEGPAFRQQLVELGCPEHKIRIHRLGIDIEQSTFQTRMLEEGSPFRVLLCGVFAERKGFPDAIAALGELSRSVDVAVTLIGDRGGRADARVRKSIFAAIDRADLQGRVRMLPFLPRRELMAEAADHHAFLSPSITTPSGDTEGGAPLALLEMAASGLPVVSTLHADIPNVLESGREALLAPEGDIRQLAKHLRELVDNAELGPRLASSARRRIERDFDTREQGKRLAAIYRELL